MSDEGLVTFLAVCDEGGVSAAAAVLHRSQPAISRRVAQFERELGVQLFDRAAGRMQLSEAGRSLMPWARRALAGLRDLDRAAAALDDPRSGSVSLALVGTLAGTALSEALREYRDGHPGVTLSVQTATSRQVSELVLSGSVQFGLRYFIDHDPFLECSEVGRERLVIACSTEHPLAGRSCASLRDLAGETFLTFPRHDLPHEATGSRIFSEFMSRSMELTDYTVIDSLTAQKRLIEAGFGIALVPESAVDEERRSGSLDVIDVRDLDSSNPITIVTRRDGYLPQATRNLIAQLSTRLG